MRTYLKAFSLIELLIVISIVGILSAIAVPAYIAYRERASAAALYPYINSELAHWKQLYDSNSPLLDQIQSGHASPGIFIDNPPMPEFQQVILYNQPGCGGPPCSFVNFVFRANSFEFVNNSITANLLYVPTIDDSNSITWDCYFQNGTDYYGQATMTPQEAVDKYFPQCSLP